MTQQFGHHVSQSETGSKVEGIQISEKALYVN